MSLSGTTMATAGFTLLVTIKRGRYSYRDPGITVRWIFHQLYSHTSENFNGQFKGTFDCLGQVPTCDYVLGAILVYQLALPSISRVAPFQFPSLRGRSLCCRLLAAERIGPTTEELSSC